MYLLPTQKELNTLWRQINPTARIMDYLYSRPPAEGSMAEFFMESEDIESAMEDDCTDYGRSYLHIDPPAYLDGPRDICPVRFKGWDIELPDPEDEYKSVYLGEKVTWDDI